jgi:hypothetical protein
VTELTVRLRGRELDYLWRHRNTFFTPDDTYISQLLRKRFIWALEELHPDEQPPRSHHRKPPPDARRRVHRRT